ncbi:response regulator [Endothiovibrio diazotrophicus]
MRILLIDDHALFRIGLEGLLDRHSIQVAAAVGDGEEGIRLARELEPDVILLDLRMPEPNGLEVLRRLRAEGIERPVVMLTTSTDEEDLISCLRTGANGYLLKDMEPDDLVTALHNVTKGETVVAKELTGVLARVIQAADKVPEEPTGQHADLTPREREILCLVAEGQSNKVIARNLGISDGTVKLHVKAILRKLTVHSRVEAAVIAVEQGMCPKG